MAPGFMLLAVLGGTCFVSSFAELEHVDACTVNHEGCDAADNYASDEFVHVVSPIDEGMFVAVNEAEGVRGNHREALAFFGIESTASLKAFKRAGRVTWLTAIAPTSRPSTNFMVHLLRIGLSVSLQR